jgi:CheY-like chemotaxis protein
MSSFPDDAFANERLMVLVASADGPTRIAVARAVGRLGMTALTTLDGAAALAAVRDHGHALLGAVLDVYLPILSGWEVARALQATASDLPLAVLERGGDSCQRRDAIQASIFSVDDESGLAAYLDCLTESLAA